MKLTLHGTVSNEQTRQGVAELIVEALDADLFQDAFLGSARTDAAGTYTIECRAPVPSVDRPDVYLRVKTRTGRLVHTTRNRIVHDADRQLVINVTLPPDTLAAAGLAAPGPMSGAVIGLDMEALDYKTWTFRAAADLQAGVLADVDDDLRDTASILDLFGRYKRVLDKSHDNQGLVWDKLTALFDAGLTPNVLDGHYYGVTLGLRTPEPSTNLAGLGNVLGTLWGGALADESPWVGKSFSALDRAAVRELTGAAPDPGQRYCLGINHFKQLHMRVVNPVAFQFLNTWMELEPAPLYEQETYGWEKNGACFIACRADSVLVPFERPVFQLNYRHKPLGNRAPNGWLIDELVQVAPGLYLGQLCYATRKLLRDYEPARPVTEYGYAHFGYFILMDSAWHGEARRLFVHLEIPEQVPGIPITMGRPVPPRALYRTFTFADREPPEGDERLLARIKSEAASHPTLMHFLKRCAEALGDHLSNQSPYFDQLAELFKRGRYPCAIDGFHHGALVGWHSEGLFRLFGVNALNLLYTSVAAPFSTWTGKRFDPLSDQQLARVTGGYETDASGAYWGCNTQSLRSMKERFVGRLMRLANVPGQPVSSGEARDHGYDLKNFFFIARPAVSITGDTAEKRILQLNYRWPNLRTIIPDAYCIDEIVEIAQGLLLGRLMYATNIALPYDPNRPAADYGYALFGYFLLMNSDWHKIRLRAGFDLHNA